MATSPADCTTPLGDMSCIQALADGWNTVSDLCPACTCTFMQALGAAVPNLVWHQGYLDRSRQRQDGTS